MIDQSYQDYLDRVDIQEVLVEAGFHHYKRDGLRYPAYVQLDSDGRRISGSKHLVTANGKCCFHPPEMKRWNIISFIKEHPELFRDFQPGMNPDRLVHLVCCRILNEPQEIRSEHIVDPRKNTKPFTLSDYAITVFDENDRYAVGLFDKFFGNRGISLESQKAFRRNFMITRHEYAEGKSVINLAFPMEAKEEHSIKGMELRGLPNKDGKSFKGMAKGTDATHAVWIGNPSNIPKNTASHVYWFESAYDAIAYYQLKAKESSDVREALFVSTSGNPSVGQMSDMMKLCPHAVHHICFDNDIAGKQFYLNFMDVAGKIGMKNELSILREIPEEGYKDWNDQLLKKPTVKVDRIIGFQDAIGRQIVVNQSISPEMLQYVDSLKDKKDVFSGDRELLPDKNTSTEFKSKIMNLLGIKGFTIGQPKDDKPISKVEEKESDAKTYGFRI